MEQFFVNPDSEQDISLARLPIQVIDYEGQYPNIPEFQKPWENVVQVGQGRAAISTDRKSLETEGISSCHIGIIGGVGFGESVMVHFEPLTRFEDFIQQQETISKLGEGSIRAILLTGTQSNSPRDSLDLLAKAGIQIQERIAVDTENKHWSVAYRPTENKIFVDQRSQKKLLIFEGFRQN